MKNLAIVAIAATMMVPGAVLAQSTGDPYGDATVSKADATKTAGDRFGTLDFNHDNIITANEMEDAAGPSARGLARADTDGDGIVTKDEFLAGQMRRFEMQDADHDGQLTKAERDAARAQMMQRMQQGS